MTLGPLPQQVTVGCAPPFLLSSFPPFLLSFFPPFLLSSFPPSLSFLRAWGRGRRTSASQGERRARCPAAPHVSHQPCVCYKSCSACSTCSHFMHARICLAHASGIWSSRQMLRAGRAGRASHRMLCTRTILVSRTRTMRAPQVLAAGARITRDGTFLLMSMCAGVS